MKIYGILYLLILPLVAITQSIDSTITKRIENLFNEINDVEYQTRIDSVYSISVKIEKQVAEGFGNESLEYGRYCHLHGKLLFLKSKYQEAEVWLKKALNIYKKLLKVQDAKYLQCIINIGINYYSKGEYSEAEKWFLETKEICLKSFGKMNVQYASSIYWLGNVQMSFKNTSDALKYHLEARELRENILGKFHVDYAASLTSLFNCYLDQSKFKQAESAILEAIEIQKSILGTSHPSYLSSKDNLANLYRKTGQLDQSLEIRKQTLEAREKVLGKFHPSYATSAFNYANILTDLGFYEDAEKYYMESLNIREKLLGKKHPQYMNTISGLASLYLSMGIYNKAESYYLQSKNLREEFFGKENTDYANALAGLANFYRKTGNYLKAESYEKEALQIIENKNGKMNLEYARGLFILANIYSNMRYYNKAEVIQINSLEILDSLVGSKNNEYAKGMNSLGIVYANLAEYNKADSCFYKALDIRKDLFGKYHRDYAKNLTNIASLYFLKKDLKKAEELYLEGIEIQDSILGKEHPDYWESLSYLENLYFVSGNYQKAYPLMVNLVDLSKLAINQAKQHLTESELDNYLIIFQDINDRLFSLASLDTIHSAKYFELGLDNLLFYKGFLLNAVNQLRNLAHIDSAAGQKWNLLKSYETMLVKELSKPIKARRDISKLKEKIDQIEKELVYSVQSYGILARQVTWKEVNNKLRINEAAVEFVKYKFNNVKDSITSEYYGALLTRWDKNQVEFIQLCEQKQLNTLFLVDSSSSKQKVISKNYTSVGGRNLLYNYLWQPLEKSLNDIKKIYLSPSGSIYQINIGAIPANNYETISDKYLLVEMGSTRSLVTDSSTTLINVLEYPNKKAILFGGVEYDLDSNKLAAFERNENFDKHSTSFSQISITGSLMGDISNSTTRGKNWQYLKWTDKEVDQIKKIFQREEINTLVYKYNDATEEHFKSISGDKAYTKFLHLSTHGYFFENSSSNSAEISEKLTTDIPFKSSENPMIRSGLILAGGNFAWTNGKSYGEYLEDGILTAYEISQMDLSNTELVVLSACETGLGDIKGNEGVYGLQRAFKIAGVKYIIMSLWQVPDKQTSQLMIAFYKNWLNRKMTIPDAFYAAQKELRNQGLDPFQWAGFILVE
jgi:CHAT domain-containing protein